LEDWDRKNRNPNTFFWWDIFTVNQHKTDEKDFQWWLGEKYWKNEKHLIDLGLGRPKAIFGLGAYGKWHAQ